MGKEKAFCTSRLLSEAYANPTAFCTAQGILMHYCTGALALWFLVYTINLVQVHLSVFHSVLSTYNILLFKHQIIQLCCSRKNPYPPHGRSSEILRGRGVLKVKILEAKYEAKLEFPRGTGGAKQKTFHGRSMDIFWN